MGVGQHFIRADVPAIIQDTSKSNVNGVLQLGLHLWCNFSDIKQKSISMISITYRLFLRRERNINKPYYDSKKV